MTLVIDTSAAVAIMGGEAEAATFTRLLISAKPRVAISAGTLIECYRVAVARTGPSGSEEVDRLLQWFAITITPVDAAQVALARDGMERFGKGRAATPAVLNFGDLFAYALARARQAPLLFEGDDFARTDVIPAWTP